MSQPSASPTVDGSKRAPPTLKKKVLALFIATFATLLACELALRMFWHNSYAGSSSELVQRIRVENANRNYLVDRSELDSETPQVWFRTDDHAYLRPSFQYEKPDATVAFLGGSTTECVVVQEPLRFPALISDLLHEKGLKVNTLNAARAANTLHDSINVLLNHLAKDHPDVVVVMHVTNDIGVLSADGDYRSRMGDRMNWLDTAKWGEQALSSRLYLAAVARKAFADSEARQRDPAMLKWRNDPAKADTVPTEAYQQRLRVLVHMARDFGIQPVLVTEPLIYSTSPLAPDWGNLGARPLQRAGAPHGPGGKRAGDRPGQAPARRRAQLEPGNGDLLRRRARDRQGLPGLRPVPGRATGTAGAQAGRRPRGA